MTFDTVNYFGNNCIKFFRNEKLLQEGRKYLEEIELHIFKNYIFQNFVEIMSFKDL